RDRQRRARRRAQRLCRGRSHLRYRQSQGDPCLPPERRAHAGAQIRTALAGLSAERLARPAGRGDAQQDDLADQGAGNPVATPPRGDTAVTRAARPTRWDAWLLIATLGFFVAAVASAYQIYRTQSTLLADIRTGNWLVVEANSEYHNAFAA